MATKTETVENVTANSTTAENSTKKTTKTTAAAKTTKTKETTAKTATAKTTTAEAAKTTAKSTAKSTSKSAPKADSKAESKSTSKAESTTKTEQKTKSSTKSKSTPKIGEIKPTVKPSASSSEEKTETKPSATESVKKTAKSVYKKAAAVKDEAVAKVSSAIVTKNEATIDPTAIKKAEEKAENKSDTIPEIKVSDVELMGEDAPKKARNKYAVMLFKEHDDGTISTHHIGTALCEFILGALFVIILICACVIVYDSVSLKKLKSEVVNQIVQINDLTEQNEILSVENDSLSSKVAVLSETVSKKAATEEAMTQEETENAMPKGFPLSGGTSTMTSGTDGDDPILMFDASAGINIVSSGTGTVLAIEDDAEYEHRIIIDHGNGYRSIYRNAGEPLVKVGDNLGKGYILFSITNGNEKIGYQIMVDNAYVDPMEVIEING